MFNAREKAKLSNILYPEDRIKGNPDLRHRFNSDPRHRSGSDSRPQARPDPRLHHGSSDKSRESSGQRATPRSPEPNSREQRPSSRPSDKAEHHSRKYL